MAPACEWCDLCDLLVFGVGLILFVTTRYQFLGLHHHLLQDLV